MATSKIIGGTINWMVSAANVSSKVTVHSIFYSCQKSGIAELWAQFSVSEAMTNNETLFSVNNITPPRHTTTIPVTSSSDKTKYGNINITAGGAVTSGGTLPAGEWYPLHITYLY